MPFTFPIAFQPGFLFKFAAELAKIYPFAPRLEEQLRTMICHQFKTQDDLSRSCACDLDAQFEKTAFSRAERQLILLTASLENNCGYCIAAHSTVAKALKVPSEVVEAIRAGKATGATCGIIAHDFFPEISQSERK